MITNSLFPHITLPTRLSEKSGSLIDHVYCKFTPNLSDVSACILTSGLSDHFPYCISINQKRVKHIFINNMTNDIIKKLKLEIKNANLLNQINIDQHTDPNINYVVIEDVLIAAKLKHVSRKRVKFNKFKHKKTEWITKGIIRSIKRRDELYREFKKTPTDSSNNKARKINLRTYNVTIKRSIFIAKKRYYHYIFQKYSSNIKNTWSIIKNLLHKKKKSNLLPNKIKIDNILNENIEVITNSFNK